MFLGFKHFELSVIDNRRMRTVVVPMHLTIAALRGGNEIPVLSGIFAQIPADAIVTDFRWDDRRGVYKIEFAHASFDAVPYDQDMPTDYITAEVGEAFVLPERRQVKRLCLGFQDIIDAFSGKLDLRDKVPHDAVLINVSYRTHESSRYGLEFLIAHPSFDSVPISDEYPKI